MPTPKKVKKVGRGKVKTVKAWMVLGVEAIAEAEIIEKDADCGCRAMFYDSPAVFKRRKDAEAWMYDYKEWVVPCTITYQLPIKPKKK